MQKYTGILLKRQIVGGVFVRLRGLQSLLALPFGAVYPEPVEGLSERAYLVCSIWLCQGNMPSCSPSEVEGKKKREMRINYW